MDRRIPRPGPSAGVNVDTWPDNRLQPTAAGAMMCRRGIASHKLGHFLMPGRYTPAMNTRESFALEIGLVTDDVTGAFARAVSEGAHAVAEPTEMPWGGTVAYVRSIEGTLIVLCTPTAS
jgi:uncharacterized glyoxalase superfamily protein PhnB